MPDEILEELGGRDILVMMIGAREFRSSNDNYVQFVTDTFRVEMCRVRNRLTETSGYSLTIWRLPSYERICRHDYITPRTGLVSRIFEFHTGYSLTFW
jgi:hypothetical protein